MKTVPYQENGVRVLMANYAAPISVAASRMSVDEARALIACIERAIRSYCGGLERNGYKTTQEAAF